MKDWNIKQLKEALINDLSMCTSQLERDYCESIGGKEIVEKAKEFACTRKLTPCETAIASEYGYVQ